MATATKSYSLDTSVIDTIADIARDFGKKQSQIIKEAIEEYAELLYDRGIAPQIDKIIDEIDQGKRKLWTREQARAIIDAA
jgi:predicted DNA-binding protein